MLFSHGLFKENLEMKVILIMREHCNPLLIVQLDPLQFLHEVISILMFVPFRI